MLPSSWHKAIIKDCEDSLGRKLTELERHFIVSRGGLVALEMIHDEIKSLKSQPQAMERYLNSEAST